MVSNQIQVVLIADDTQVQATLKQDKVALDQLTREWKEKEREIITGMRSAQNVINNVVSAYRVALSAINQTLDPVTSALLSTITTGVNVAVSTASMLISGIVTAPIGLILMAAAFGVQLGTTAAMLQDMAEAKSIMAFAMAKASAINVNIVAGGAAF